tara:strand:- start:3210 stop:5411 length:2202 start_codon:yes stop_codon:yes gene_type:complete
MRKQKKILAISLFTAFFWSCENVDDEQDVLILNKNTLNSDLPGATTGHINDYFYNFNEDVNAQFFRYNPSLMKNYNTYSDYYNLFGEDPPLMNYRTFPDHLLSMTTEDEAEYTYREPIPALTVIDSIVADSVQMTSTPFKNLESLEWNLEAEPSLQRYKLVNSDWVLEDTMLYFNDTFNINYYRAIVDTPFIDEGILFVDSSVWTDTNYTFYADEQIRFLNTFEFERKQLSDDSLVFRVNTDCNDNGHYDGVEQIIQDYNGNGIFEVLYEYSDNNYNGVYDEDSDDIIEDYNGDNIISIAYEFEDHGNMIWDPAEPYYDVNDNGEFDLSEPYQDRNCNEKWDDEESYIDNDDDGLFSDGDSFIDRGNQLFDSAEEYRLKDLDNDGVEDTLLFYIGDKPNNLLVDWSDSNNPVALLEISLGDDITDRWGNVFNDVIEEEDFFDLKQQYVDDVDSLVTLFTRRKVGHVSNAPTLDPDDYYITKSEWTKTSGGVTEQFYNYHIFHNPEHLNQIVYPSYFLPVGFYYSPNEIDDGFWHKKNLESEVLYYTSNGLLRDGEQIDTSYFDTTAISVYYVEKSYTVESSSVTVPAGNRESLDEPAQDMTFDDCFKVTQHLNMTMVGSGIEFGQKTESYLAKGKGLVKSEVFIRWSEHPYSSAFTPNSGTLDENNEAWVGLNRIELNSVEITAENSVFKKLTRPVKEIQLRNIGEDPDFNFDPFKISTQTGIQTLDLRELNE